MNKLQQFFEREVLRNTCFSTLKELLEDKTLVDVNAPRALIAVELKGVWRGLQIAAENQGKLLCALTPEDHKERHKFLHSCLDELIADMISHTDMLPSKVPVVMLMAWSNRQTEHPTEKKHGKV